MSQLTIYADNDAKSELKNLNGFDEIQKELDAIQVLFRRWQTDSNSNRLKSDYDILGAYKKSIDELKKQHGFITEDIISISPKTPNHEQLRAKFLQEHTHSDHEARFFISGSGMFYIHAEQKVYKLLCEQGDLINVPAGAKHWFDMGSKPDFKCIRVFTNKEGWVAEYTGSAIAETFPKFDS